MYYIIKLSSGQFNLVYDWDDDDNDDGDDDEDGDVDNNNNDSNIEADLPMMDNSPLSWISGSEISPLFTNLIDSTLRIYKRFL